MSKKKMEEFLRENGLGGYLTPQEEPVIEEENIPDELEPEVEEVLEEEIVEVQGIEDVKTESFEDFYEEEENVEEEVKEEDFLDWVDGEIEEENEEEILGGNDMNNNMTLTKRVINDNYFRKYETFLNGDFIKGILSSKLLYQVNSMKLNRQAFFEKFLSNNVEVVTNEEKEEMTKEYYPSSFTGSAVEYVLYVDIPQDALASVTPANTNGLNPLFWSAVTNDVKSYTDRYPEIFGSRVFIPTLNVKDRDGRNYYIIFISTLHAILFVEGISVSELRDRMTKVSISTVMTAKNALSKNAKDPIQHGINQGNVELEDSYVIQYVKA